MLQYTRLENLLFIDIQTVPIVKSFDELDEDYKKLWERKSKYFREELEPAEAFEKKAGLYAEFAKISCISLAYLRMEDNRFHLRMKSFYGHDEKQVIEDFRELIVTYFNQRKYVFCGHNIKDFDIPFLCRRMLINDFILPHKFNYSGNKSSQPHVVDTFQIWRFGDYKNYTSLRLLAKSLKIEHPEEFLEANQVAGMYWKDDDLEGIKEYCQRDVITVAQLMLKFKRFELLEEDHIQMSE